MNGIFFDRDYLFDAVISARSGPIDLYLWKVRMETKKRAEMRGRLGPIK